MCMYVYNYLTWTTLCNQGEISINSGPALEKRKTKIKIKKQIQYEILK